MTAAAPPLVEVLSGSSCFRPIFIKLESGHNDRVCPSSVLIGGFRQQFPA
jgi:hypothetical protein